MADPFRNYSRLEKIVGLIALVVFLVLWFFPAKSQYYPPPPGQAYSCPPYCGPGVYMPVPREPPPDYLGEYRRWRDAPPDTRPRRCLDRNGYLVHCFRR